ncbi:MAG: hypothetical protein JO261_16085 [Alphaproteobacteria bacterium]|nr:hypothetical protein [Alphaproteobacteria bacterium]MBV9695212.1 hypothetical protein [Alphaproteobacteria bacterium]
MRRIAAVFLMAAALTACGKSDTKTYSDSKGNNVTVSNGGNGGDSHMTFTGANGEKAEFNTGANAKMPPNLPLYPGANVTASFSGQGKDGAGGMVAFHAKAAPAEIIAFYKQKAEASGMAQTAMMDMGGSSTYVAANEKENRTVSVTVTKAGDGTDAQITWGSK